MTVNPTVNKIWEIVKASFIEVFVNQPKSWFARATGTSTEAIEPRKSMSRFIQTYLWLVGVCFFAPVLAMPVLYFYYISFGVVFYDAMVDIYQLMNA